MASPFDIINDLSTKQNIGVSSTELIDDFVKTHGAKYPDLTKKIQGFRDKNEYDADILTGLKGKLKRVGEAPEEIGAAAKFPPLSLLETAVTSPEMLARNVLAGQARAMQPKSMGTFQQTPGRAEMSVTSPEQAEAIEKRLRELNTNPIGTSEGDLARVAGEINLGKTAPPAPPAPTIRPEDKSNIVPIRQGVQGAYGSYVRLLAAPFSLLDRATKEMLKATGADKVFKPGETAKMLYEFARKLEPNADEVKSYDTFKDHVLRGVVEGTLTMPQYMPATKTATSLMGGAEAVASNVAKRHAANILGMAATDAVRESSPEGRGSVAGAVQGAKFGTGLGIADQASRILFPQNKLARTIAGTLGAATTAGALAEGGVKERVAAGTTLGLMHLAGRPWRAPNEPKPTTSIPGDSMGGTTRASDTTTPGGGAGGAKQGTGDQGPKTGAPGAGKEEPPLENLPVKVGEIRTIIRKIQKERNVSVAEAIKIYREQQAAAEAIKIYREQQAAAEAIKIYREQQSAASQPMSTAGTEATQGLTKEPEQGLLPFGKKPDIPLEGLAPSETKGLGVGSPIKVLEPGTPSETGIESTKSPIAEPGKEMTVYRAGRREGGQGHPDTGTWFWRKKRPELGEDAKESKITPKNPLIVSEVTNESIPSMTLLERWFPEYNKPVEEGGLPQKKVMTPFEIDKIVRAEAEKRGYDAIIYGEGELSQIQYFGKKEKPPIEKTEAPGAAAPVAEKVTPAEEAPSSPTFKRSTPAKGTPERTKLNEQYKAKDEEDTRLIREQEGVRQDLQKTRAQGKTASLRNKSIKLGEQIYKNREESKIIDEQYRRAIMEDYVENGDAIQKIEASHRLKLIGNKERNDLVKDLVTERLQKRGISGKELDQMASEASGHSSILGDGLNKTIDIAINKTRAPKLREEVRKQIEKMDLSDSSKERFIRAVKASSIWEEDIKSVLENAKREEAEVGPSVRERIAKEKAAVKAKEDALKALVEEFKDKNYYQVKTEIDSVIGKRKESSLSPSEKERVDKLREVLATKEDDLFSEIPEKSSKPTAASMGMTKAAGATWCQVKDSKGNEYWTDGRIIDTGKMRYDIAPEAMLGGETNPGLIDGLINQAMPNPLTKVGVRTDPTGHLNSVVFEHDGKVFAVDKKYYDYFLNKYKKVEFRGTKPDEQIGVFVGDKPVGLIMPMRWDHNPSPKAIRAAIEKNKGAKVEAPKEETKAPEPVKEEAPAPEETKGERKMTVEDNMDLADINRIDRLKALQERFPGKETIDLVKLSKAIDEKKTGTTGEFPKTDKTMPPEGEWDVGKIKPTDFNRKMAQSFRDKAADIVRRPMEPESEAKKALLKLADMHDGKIPLPESLAGITTHAQVEDLVGPRKLKGRSLETIQRENKLRRNRLKEAGLETEKQIDAARVALLGTKKKPPVTGVRPEKFKGQIPLEVSKEITKEITNEGNKPGNAGFREMMKDNDALKAEIRRRYEERLASGTEGARYAKEPVYEKGAKETTLATDKELDSVVKEVADVLGPRFGVHFKMEIEPNLKDPSTIKALASNVGWREAKRIAKEGDLDAAYRILGRNRTSGERAKDAHGVIELALFSQTGKQITDTNRHEMYEILRRHFMSNKQRRLMDGMFEPDKDPKTGEVKKSSLEKQADAFAEYWNKNTPPKNPQARSLWSNIKLNLVRLGNFLRGRGFNTVDDVFAAAKSGKLRKHGVGANREVERMKVGEGLQVGGVPPSGGAPPKNPNPVPNNLYPIEMPELLRYFKNLHPEGKVRLTKLIQSMGGQILGSFNIKSGNINLARSIFRNVGQAAKVFSHELGHLSDWIPDRTVLRGNLLGHIASLKNYMGKYLEEFPGATGKPMTNAEMAALKAEAARQAKVTAPVVGKTISAQDITDVWNSLTKKNPGLETYIKGLSNAQKSELVKVAMRGNIPPWFSYSAAAQAPATHKSIQDIFEKLVLDEVHKRRMYEVEQIQRELKTFTQVWNPFVINRNPKYTKYRFSAEELYADALSGLYQNPELLKQHAPNFTKGFFAYIEQKPEVKSSYDAIQKVLKGGPEEIGKIRDAEDRRISEENEILAQKKPPKPYNLASKLAQSMIDKFESVYHVMRGSPEEKAKAQGAIHNMVLGDSEGLAHAKEIIQWVIKPLEKANVDHVDFDSYVKYMRIVHERPSVGQKPIPEPQGFDAKTAQDQLNFLQKKVGPEKWQAMEDAQKNWNNERQLHIVPIVELSKMYSKVLTEKMKDNKFWATFSSQKFMENGFGVSFSGRIFGRKGSLDSVSDPFITSILRDIATIKSVNRNNAVQAVVEGLIRIKGQGKLPEGSFIEKAPNLWNGHGWTPKEPNKAGQGMLVFLRDGKAEGYYVPIEMERSFGTSPDLQGKFGSFVHLFSFLNAPFRQLFINKNPGFWAFNDLRDLQSGIRTIPGAALHPLAFTVEWLKAHRTAYEGVKRYDPTSQEMLRRKELIASFDRMGENNQSKMIDKFLIETGYFKGSQANGVYQGLANFAKGLNRGMDVLASTGERTTKIAADRWLRKRYPNMPESEIAFHVRKAGSPRFLDRGIHTPLTNNLLFLSNAAVQSYRSHWEYAKADPLTWGTKAFAYTVLPRLAMWTMGAGIMDQVFGSEKEGTIKKLYDMIPRFQKNNYLTPILGSTPEGQVVYMTIPQDEQTRLMGGLVQAIFEGVESTEDMAQIFNTFTAQGLPGLAPVINLLQYTLNAMAGQNSYDNFRGQPIITDQELKAGGVEKWKAIAKYTWNTQGGSIIYKFSNENPEHIKSELEQVLNAPITSNLIGRFLKVTNYGTSERIKRAQAPTVQQEARDSLRIRDMASKINMGQTKDITKEELLAAAKHPEALKENIVKGSLHRNNQVYMERFKQAATQEQKIAVLKQWAEDRAPIKPGYKIPGVRY